MLYRLLFAPFCSIWYLCFLWTRLWLHFVAIAAVRAVLFQAYLLGILLGIYEKFWGRCSVPTTTSRAREPATDPLRWWTNRLYASQRSLSRSVARGSGRDNGNSGALNPIQMSSIHPSPVAYLQAGLEHVRISMEGKLPGRRRRYQQTSRQERRSPRLSHGTPRQRTPTHLIPSPFSDALPPPASPYCSHPRSPTRSLPLPGVWSPIAVRSTPSTDGVGALSPLRAAGGTGDTSSPDPSSSVASVCLTRGSSTISHVRRPSSCKRSSGTLLSKAFGYSASLQTRPASTASIQACSQLPRRELHFSVNAADTAPQSQRSDDPCKEMPTIAGVVLAPERAAGDSHDARPYVLNDMGESSSGFGAEAAGLKMVITPSSSPGARAANAQQDRGISVANCAPASADVAVGASSCAYGVAAASPCPLAEAAQESSIGSTTPRAHQEGDIEWGSDTLSKDTANQPSNEEEPRAADADAEWSFDTPTRQMDGSGKTKPLHRASSPLMTAMWPRGDWKKARSTPADGVGAAGGHCRKEASPMTPSAGSQPVSAASRSCYTLALSPDFSPTLPLPSKTLLSRDNPSPYPSGNGSNAAVVLTPQCALPPSVRKEEDGEGDGEGEEKGGDVASESITSSLTAFTSPKRRLVEKTPRKEELLTPRSGLSTSSRSLRGGEVPTMPASVVYRSVSCSSVPLSQKLSSTVRQPGVAETASGANPNTATLQSGTCSAGKYGDRFTSSMLSRSRGSSMSSSSEAIATGSGKKPRYLQSTVSWNLKHG
ncbi:hypothetical protein Vafri_269 [Volvox africanus]|nr:hypothetical protein Vafri_269 [Volvox africanus]